MHIYIYKYIPISISRQIYTCVYIRIHMCKIENVKIQTHLKPCNRRFRTIDPTNGCFQKLGVLDVGVLVLGPLIFGNSQISNLVDFKHRPANHGQVFLSQPALVVASSSSAKVYSGPARTTWS